MERNSKTKLYYYFLGQNPFLPFLKNKKYLTNSNFEFYFWQMFFDVKGRFLQTFKKNINFQGPCFFENENFAAQAPHAPRQNSPIIVNWVNKNIANR